MQRETGGFLSGFPEAFYDGIAYIIPAAYLVAGIELLRNPLSSIIQSYLENPPSFVIDIFLALALFGGLYLIGQVLTTLSYYVFLVPLKMKRKYREAWYKDYRRIER